MKRILAVLLLLCLLPGCTYSDRQDLLHFYLMISGLRLR